MLNLRIVPERRPDGVVQISMQLRGDALEPRSADGAIAFLLGDAFERDLRWYFETFHLFPRDAGQRMGQRVSNQIENFGRGLFQAVFALSDEAKAIWGIVAPRLAETRVEIQDSLATAGIPWEWILPPDSKEWLVLSAGELVRTIGGQRSGPDDAADLHELRVLLVISRPHDTADVPYRALANQVLRTVSEDPYQRVHVDVLRPPTFEALQAELREAKASGYPYHAVHFDGHGIYQDLYARPGTRGTPRGYLAFETGPGVTHEAVPVDGSALGKALVAGGVSTLILNACRSAYAELPDSMEAAKAVEPEAFGSVALDALEAGVSDVLAMRYNIEVPAAARVMRSAYTAMRSDLTMGEMVAAVRKELFQQATARSEEEPRLEWLVPIAYERGRPDASRRRTVPGGERRMSRFDAVADEKLSGAYRRLPAPEAGFVGRDGVLLELDRLFDLNFIILHHGVAGNGTSVTAAEFASWYWLTGALEGPLVHTPFAERRTFDDVLSDLLAIFAGSLAQIGINLPSLSKDERRQLTLELLAQGTMLWIWDGVESVRTWPAEERDRLLPFMLACGRVRARFLLTSTHEERDWLGANPGRVPLLRMPDGEVTQLLGRLAFKHQRARLYLDDWQPLIRNAFGNPGAITTLATIAFEESLDETGGIGALVDLLLPLPGSGAGAATDQRRRRVMAGLPERMEAVLPPHTDPAELSWFGQCTGYVDLDLLDFVRAEPTLETTGDVFSGVLSGARRSATMHAIFRALVEGGLIHPTISGREGLAHPALSLAVRQVVEKRTGSAEPVDPGRWTSAVRLYFVALDQMREEIPAVTESLQRHEPNLRLAVRLAVATGAAEEAATLARIVGTDLAAASRWDEWEEIVSYVTPRVQEPKPGDAYESMHAWRLITDCRVSIARGRGDAAEARALQQTLADRLIAAAGGDDHEALHSAAQACVKLGQMQMLMHEDAGPTLRQAVDLGRRSGFDESIADSTVNLAELLLIGDDGRAPEEVEPLIEESLRHRPAKDALGRAHCFGILSRWQLRRAQQQESPAREELLRKALGSIERALRIIPKNTGRQIAVLHGDASAACDALGDQEQSLAHALEAIRGFDAAEDAQGSARARLNLARRMISWNQQTEARAFVESALRVAERGGAGARREAEEARGALGLTPGQEEAT